MRPEWNLHFLVAIEALKILSRDGEGTIFSDFVMVRSAATALAGFVAV